MKGPGKTLVEVFDEEPLCPTAEAENRRHLANVALEKAELARMLANAYAVKCKRCRSPAGRRCLKAEGGFARRPHKVRWNKGNVPKMRSP